MYKDISVSNGVTIHYVEAGVSSPTKPTLLLLHGFPSSSNQFRNFIPLLAEHIHVIAPDLPGFGFTKPPQGYQHTFDNMAQTVGLLLDELKITRVIAYVFDYGSPTAFRLALKRLDLIQGLITQNGNAYVEGLGSDFWAPLQEWWSTSDPSHAQREVVRSGALNLEATKWQYTQGTPRHLLDNLDPVTWTYDHLLNLASPEQQEIQLDLFWDYQNNIKLYPRFQGWLRTGIPVLAVWGKGDLCFVPEGAEAYKRDAKDVSVELLDGGHFLLESHGEEVARRVISFIKRFE